MEPPRHLGLLERRWRLERVIDDRRAGTRATLAGKAWLRRDGRRLVYEETGELFLPGQGAPIHATRRYLWTRQRGTVWVEFDDGRPFHTFPMGAPRPEARHFCPPDHYKVAYDFCLWPDWTATWEVSGPRKDYVMRSSYTARN